MTCSLPHLDIERQRGVNDYWSCILGNLCGAWSQTSINNKLVALVGRWARYILVTASQTITTKFIFNAVTQCSWAFLPIKLVKPWYIENNGLWGNSPSIRVEVNGIDDHTDISLELTTMRDSRRAALMQQSCTLPWRDPAIDIRTLCSYLRDTCRRNKTPWSTNKTCLRKISQASIRSLLVTPSPVSFLSSPSAGRLFPSNPAPPFVLVLPYSPLAPMCYPVRPSLPI